MKPWEKDTATQANRTVRVPSRPVVSPRRPGISTQQQKATLRTEPSKLKTKIRNRKDILPNLLATLRSAPKKIAKLPRKALIGGLCLVLIVGYAGTQLIKPQAATPKGDATAIKGRTSGLPRNEKPSFITVVPADKTIEELGGWTRISPENRDPVYAFADTLNKIPIRVSEQKLPNGFTGNIDEKVEELSAGFNADQKLKVDGVTAYIGTSAKGPQSVIFEKNGLLVLIVSDQKIGNDYWTAYISSLQ